MNRRDQILETAAELFAGQGVPRRLGRRDRPGLRHLRAGALQALRRPRTPCWRRCWSASARRSSRRAGRAVAALRRRASAVEALVAWHIDFALRHRSLIVVQDRDWQSLPPDGPRAGAPPPARVRRRVGRAAAPAPPRAAHRPGPGDGPRGVRPDQLHAAQRPDRRRGRCASCCTGWRSARSVGGPHSDQVADLGRRVVGEGQHPRGPARPRPWRPTRSSADGVSAVALDGRPGCRSSGLQTAQPQQHPRVTVDQPGDLEHHRQRVDARVDPGTARAGRPQLTAVGQQLDAGLLGLLDEPMRAARRPCSAARCPDSPATTSTNARRLIGSSSGTVATTGHTSARSSVPGHAPSRRRR